MPDVRLTRKEEEGRLPPVCMGCGAPATAWVERRFPLHPPIVHGPSGFAEVHAIRLLFAAAKVPRIRLRTSFCSRHRHYWHWRFFLQFGGLGGMFAVLLAGVAVVVVLLTVFKIDAPWLSCCVIVPLLAYLAPWIIASKMVADRTIRVRLADGETEAVMLVNVDARYIEALETQRAQARSPSDPSATIPTAILLKPNPPPSQPPVVELVDEESEDVRDRGEGR